MTNYSKQKGYNFEVKVAKSICKFFGITEWQRYLPRTRVGGVYHSDSQKGGQLMGDLSPTHEMTEATGWRFPIECKNRKGWSLVTMMKNFTSSKPYIWFQESKEEISPELWPFILVFTQNNAPMFVMHTAFKVNTYPVVFFDVESEIYTVELLDTFLRREFSADYPITLADYPITLADTHTPYKKAHKIRKVDTDGTSY